MSEHALDVYAREVSARLTQGLGADPSGDQVAAAVRAFLVEHQPWLAARVRVAAGDGCAVVTAPASGPVRLGERPIDLLRAVQGVMGMADKLPEVHSDEGLPEVHADPAHFLLPAEDPAPERPEGTEILRSRVRYFPLPTCEWFEVCDGELILQPLRVTFEPECQIMSERRSMGTAGKHVLELGRVRRVRRDSWWVLPCLRLDVNEGAYRYGWPALRTDPAAEFELDEWLATLKRLMDHLRRGDPGPGGGPVENVVEE